MTVCIPLASSLSLWTDSSRFSFSSSSLSRKAFLSMTWFIRCSKSSRDMMVALRQAERTYCAILCIYWQVSQALHACVNMYQLYLPLSTDLLVLSRSSLDCSNSLIYFCRWSLTALVSPSSSSSVDMCLKASECWTSNFSYKKHKNKWTETDSASLARSWQINQHSCRSNFNKKRWLFY